MANSVELELFIIQVEVPFMGCLLILLGIVISTVFLYTGFQVDNMSLVIIGFSGNLLLIAAACITILSAHDRNAKRLQKLRSELEYFIINLSGFNPTQYFISADCDGLIAFDEARKTIGIVEMDSSSATGFSIQLFTPDELAGSQIIEDSPVVLNIKNRNSTGKIILQVNVKQNNNSVYRIVFARYTTMTSMTVEAQRSAAHWHNLIKFLMENHVTSVETSQHTIEPYRVADEISKLAALMNQGLITEEEFETQKAKLLSR